MLDTHQNLDTTVCLLISDTLIREIMSLTLFKKYGNKIIACLNTGFSL